MRISLGDIAKATGGRLSQGYAFAEVKGVSTDTRSLRKGELFVAIEGKRYDGHDFIPEALSKGAGCIVSHRGKGSFRSFTTGEGRNRGIVKVGDTLIALGDLAQFYRASFDIPVVAITGSTGKTTTKEMIAGVLGNGWRPLKNKGTQNNLIGVPRTLFNLNSNYDSLVLELGASRRGEIMRLADISKPNIGILTNIGPSHLEYIGTLEDVFRAKTELLRHLGRWDTAILNSDDRYMRRLRKGGRHTYTIGIVNEADFRAEGIVKEAVGWSFTVKGGRYRLKTLPYHSIYNALAAICTGYLFGIAKRDIARALEHFGGVEGRMCARRVNGILVIDDTYNSNPLSAESALRTLASYGGAGKRILVCADMKELGRSCRYYHRRLGRLAASSGIEVFIAVGEAMRESFKAAKRYGMAQAHFFREGVDVSSFLKDISDTGDVILLKGSREMRMEEVLRCFITSFIP